MADDLSIKHAKKSQELQSDVRSPFQSCNQAHFITVHSHFIPLCDSVSQLAYKADTEQIIHQYTMTKDEPLFRQAKANADLLSGVSSVTITSVHYCSYLLNYKMWFYFPMICCDLSENYEITRILFYVIWLVVQQALDIS